MNVKGDFNPLLIRTHSFLNLTNVKRKKSIGYHIYVLIMVLSLLTQAGFTPTSLCITPIQRRVFLLKEPVTLIKEF